MKRWNRAVTRGIGAELRRARKARGWTCAEMAARLPSGITDRTLLSYEEGSRQPTTTRFVEICEALEINPATILQRALQRARLNLANLTIQVDLRALLKENSATCRPMAQWARNALNENPEGIVELEPAVVKHLALASGFAYRDLANYLSRFIPNNDSHVYGNK